MAQGVSMGEGCPNAGAGESPYRKSPARLSDRVSPGARKCRGRLPGAAGARNRQAGPSGPSTPTDSAVALARGPRAAVTQRAGTPARRAPSRRRTAPWAAVPRRRAAARVAAHAPSLLRSPGSHPSTCSSPPSRRRVHPVAARSWAGDRDRVCFAAVVAAGCPAEEGSVARRMAGANGVVGAYREKTLVLTVGGPGERRRVKGKCSYRT